MCQHIDSDTVKICHEADTMATRDYSAFRCSNSTVAVMVGLNALMLADAPFLVRQ